MTSLMAGFSAREVAKAFVEQYYMILNKCPENTHKFYQESSLLGWPGPDGDVTSVATLSGIKDKIISSDYVSCSVETKTVDAQESFDGGVIVAVTGFWTGKDDVRKNFSQTFFLAKNEKGFFVLNDILRFIEVLEVRGLVANTVVHDDYTNDQVAPTQNSDHSALLPIKELVENGNVLDASDLSVSEDTAVNVAASTTYVASSEDVCPVLAPASNIKKDANIPKITYASMVARKGPLTSPKIENVPSNSDNQRVAPPTAKASAPLGDGASRVSTPRSIVSKPSAPPSNAVPKARTGGNSVPNTTSRSAEARGIYIGRLPYDISKQGVMEVLKQFGPIKKNPDSIQIKRHEDGFCCGFVEFESVDSARQAVEAHHVMFGDKEAYIAHKRSSSSSSSNRANNERGRSPSSSTGFQNANYMGQDNGEATNGKFQNKNRSSYDKGQARGPRRSTQSDRWSSQEVEIDQKIAETDLH